MTHITDNKELHQMVKKCNELATELGIDFVAITVSDAPNADGDDDTIYTKHYSSMGNFELANTALLAQHVDFSMDIYNIMGEERALPLLQDHAAVLQEAMWMELADAKAKSS